MDRGNEELDDNAKAEDESAKLEGSKCPTPTGSGNVKQESDGELPTRPEDNDNATQTEGAQSGSGANKKKKYNTSKKMKQEQENDIQWLGDKVWISVFARHYSYLVYSVWQMLLRLLSVLHT